MQVNFGKTFIVGFEDQELNFDLERKLLEINPAGVILFDPNLQDANKTKMLIKDLKDLLGHNLFVSVDQEGGKVQRLRNVSYELPSLLSVGLTSRNSTQENSFLFSREVLVSYAQALAYQLNDFGFNFVYAPCADLMIEKTNPIIGSRSLGEDYRIVSEQLKVIIKELKKYNILTCAKHFPGHGDAKADSHLQLPHVVRNTQEELINLKPFIAAVEAGVDSVMVAHLFLEIEENSMVDTLLIDESNISKDEIANLRVLEKKFSGKIASSLNKELISKELVYLLGFKGLIVSDEITMKALSEFGNYSELAIKLLEAGNNLIIWNTNIDDALQSSRLLNSLCQEDYPDLFNAYQKSLEKITTFKNLTSIVRNNNNFVYDEDYFIDLVIKSFDKDLELDFKDWDLVLVNCHPKLEIQKVEEVFGVPVKNIDKENYESKNILVLLFQANIDDLYNIKKLRAKNNLLQVSTDVHDPGSDINIKGACKLHYKALKKFLRI